MYVCVVHALFDYHSNNFVMVCIVLFPVRIYGKLEYMYVMYSM